MQYDAAKHTGSTAQCWRRTQFQILVILLKWYIQIFLAKMVVRIHFTQTQKTDNGDQNGKPSTWLFPLSSKYYHHFHRLLAVPPKHCSTHTAPSYWITCFHLDTITEFSGGDWSPYRYVIELVYDRCYYRYLLIFH